MDLTYDIEENSIEGYIDLSDDLKSTFLSTWERANLSILSELYILVQVSEEFVEFSFEFWT
jgi:hypothetical protein